MNIKSDNYKVEIIKNKSERGYLAYIKELDCTGDWNTIEEAYKDVIKVANDIIEIDKKDSLYVPLPNEKITKKLDIKSIEDIRKLKAKDYWKS